MARLHQTTINDLPDPIVADILSRLPTKTIFNSRFVCKLWNYLTTKDSSFPKLHFSRSHLEFLVQNKDESNWGVADWIDPEFDMTRGFGTRVTVKPRTQIPCTNLGLVNSCRGLVLCLHKGRTSDLGVICNPLTGEYLTLPVVEKGDVNGSDYEDNLWDEMEDVMEEHSCRAYIDSLDDALYCFNAYAFGYCSSTNQFKVLRIFTGDECSWVDSIFSGDECSWEDSGMAEINVVGTDSWRVIGSAPFCPPYEAHPILLNEVVHWMCDDNEVKKFIVYFDFESESERFGEFEPPVWIVKNFQKRKYRMTLSVLGGCLAVCDVLTTGKFDIWVMKEYGVEGSWSKDFVVDTTVVKKNVHARKHQPLKVLSDGEILMLSLGDGPKYPKFVRYDPEDNAVRVLKLLWYDRFEVVAHTPSFISLNDVIMGDNLNVLKFKDAVSDNGHGRQRRLPDPSRVGIWSTHLAPLVVEYCFSTVDDFQKLPD